MHSIVAATVVFGATGSTLAVSLVSMAQFGPTLLLGPLAGRWADTGSPVRQMILGRTLCCAGSGLAAAYLVLFGDRSDAAVVTGMLAGSLLAGFGFTVGGPAMQTIVPGLVGRDELARAMTVNTMPMTVSRIAGPALGAVLATRWTPAGTLALCAVTHAVFIALIVLARFPASVRSIRTDDRTIGFAWRFVRRDRALLMLLLGVATVGLGTDPSITLAPATSVAVTGDVDLVGPLATAFGCGAFSGLLILLMLLHRWSHRHVAYISVAVMAAGHLLAATSEASGLWVVLAGFIVAGIGFSMAMGCLGTAIQERTPDLLRGRVMSMWMIGFVGARPIGGPVLAVVADRWSVGVAFLVLGLLTAAVAALVAIAVGRRVAPIEDEATPMR